MASVSNRRIPGPQKRAITGNLREFREDILAFFTKCARDYGDTCSFRIGLTRCVLISHPDSIELVLAKNSQNFRKHYGARQIRRLLGNGLFTSEGAIWKRQRRVIAPVFSAERLANYSQVVVTTATRQLDSWLEGQLRNIDMDMMHLTLAIASRAFFGDELQDVAQVDEALAHALRDFELRTTSAISFPSWLPTTRNRQFRASLRGLNRTVQGIVEKRGGAAHTERDLLSALLKARDSIDGMQMSEQQIVDEVRTFLLAGHETSALLLTWAMYLLAKHPEVQERLRLEVQATVGNRMPDFSDIPRLKFAEHVAQETLRLYSPSYAMGREAIQGCELGGYFVPAKTTVFMSQWVVHRDPRFFDNPEEFRPERWENGLAKKLPRMAFFPFGGGPRSCIGSSFAMMEAVLVLALLVQRFRLECPDGSIWPGLAPIYTLRPRDPVNLRICQA